MAHLRAVVHTALACAFFVVCAHPSTAANARHDKSDRPTAAQAVQIRGLRHDILEQIRYTNEWWAQALKFDAPSRRLQMVSTNIPHLKWLLKVKKRQHRLAKAYAQNPPHKSAWLCIHRYEGSWTDTGSPYYGGLQMDVTFQASYAPRLLRDKGTAENWTPLQQMWTAEKAYRSGRGFYPWPNTARTCGLI